MFSPSAEQRGGRRVEVFSPSVMRERRDGNERGTERGKTVRHRSVHSVSEEREREGGGTNQ